MSRKLIITADDYGMCDAVNKAIEECLAAGALHAVCIMANMPAFGAVASLRNHFPQASVGLHWTLTQGKPLLPATQVPSLVSADGCFPTLSQFKRKWLIRQVKLAEMKAELRAQYERFCEVAGVPDFWNTHHNVHTFPGLFGAFVALGQELGISATRCQAYITVPRRGTPTRYNLRHPLYWLKRQVLRWWSDQAKARGVLMPDGKIDIPGYGVGKAAIEEVVQHIQWDSVRKAVELVIHPATTIHKDLFGSLTESRIREYQVFRDPELVERLRQVGVETVGFDALRNSHLTVCSLLQTSSDIAINST